VRRAVGGDAALEGDDGAGGAVHGRRAGAGDHGRAWRRRRFGGERFGAAASSRGAGGGTGRAGWRQRSGKHDPGGARSASGQQRTGAVDTRARAAATVAAGRTGTEVSSSSPL